MLPVVQQVQPATGTIIDPHQPAITFQVMETRGQSIQWQQARGTGLAYPLSIHPQPADAAGIRWWRGRVFAVALPVVSRILAQQLTEQSVLGQNSYQPATRNNCQCDQRYLHDEDNA